MIDFNLRVVLVIKVLLCALLGRVYSDLFSQFDPYVSILYTMVSVWGFWWFNFYLVFLLCFSSVMVELGGFISFFFNIMVKFLLRFSEVGMWRFSGSTNLLVAIFFLVLLVNWLGLLPGTFRLSRHFIFSIAFAVPLWLGGVMLGFRKLPLVKLSRVIGSGIPLALRSSIGVCEVVRILMRPVALGLRLAANMLAGHVITSLVANCSMSSYNTLSLICFLFFSFSVLLFFFEAAVCVIQAFVFIMLLRIYILETPL